VSLLRTSAAAGWRPFTTQSRAEAAAASVLQATGFRGDVTVFHLNAAAEGRSGLEAAFRRNTAERVYLIEAAHNPEVAGSNPAPATEKAPETGPLLCRSERQRSIRDVEPVRPDRRAFLVPTT
jgi:hypothetical protein